MNITEYISSSLPSGYKSDGTPLYDCPLCRGRQKLEVHLHRPLYHCHKCKAEGNFKEAEGSLGWRTSPRREVDLEREPFSFIPCGPADPQWTYLEMKRCLPTKLIYELRPHVCLQAPLRVFFPLYNLWETEPCYYVGRLIIDRDDLVPWYNPPSEMFPNRKPGMLWGLHRLEYLLSRKPSSMEKKGVILVEGIFDAVWSWNRLALLGNSLSGHQAETIKRINPEKVVIMLDGDRPEGSTYTAAKNLAKLYHGPIWAIFLPDNRDPDSYGEDLNPTKLRWGVVDVPPLQPRRLL